MANSPSGDSVLDRFERILGAFDASQTSLTVSALAERADIPLATAYRLVDDLVCRGLLARNPERQITLGIRLWELASRSSPALDLREAAMPFMEDIQAVIRQHTQLGVLREDEVLIIERLSGRGSVVNQARIAGRLPVHRTSSGLVLLAFSEPAVQEAYLARHPDAGITTGQASYDFRALLSQVRRQGYAHLDGLVDLDTSGIAVPVRPGRGEVAALGVVVPRGDGANLHAIVPLLTAGARGIARSMGARPGAR